MASLLDPLVVPPRLLLRALDDLHTLAQAVPRVLDLGERILDLGERIDDRAEAILELGSRIDRQGEALVALGGEMQDLGGRVLGQGDLIEQRAREVADRAAQVIAALPLLERAVALGEPLEGTVERLGRMVDRLPGGPLSRRRPSDP